MGRVILRVGGTLARYYISEQYLTNGIMMRAKRPAVASSFGCFSINNYKDIE